MATCSELQTRLADAEQQYHDLITGGRVEQLGTGEKNLRRTASSPTDLLRYIASLRAQVEACTGVRDNGQRTVLRMVPR